MRKKFLYYPPPKNNFILNQLLKVWLVQDLLTEIPHFFPRLDIQASYVRKKAECGRNTNICFWQMTANPQLHKE